MPRANRYHIPGCIWHITHRCAIASLIESVLPNCLVTAMWTISFLEQVAMSSGPLKA